MSSPDRLVLNDSHEAGNEAGTNDMISLSSTLRKRILKLYGKYLSEDGQTVDYSSMKGSPEFQEYKELASSLKTVSGLDSSPENVRKAFWINVYNALVIHANVEADAYDPSKLFQFFGGVSYNVAGQVCSLDEIEHGILRANTMHPTAKKVFFENDDLRLPWKLSSVDPRLHFALVCGAKSCPAIRVYTDANIDQALDMAASSFCEQHVSITQTGSVLLSKLLDWYAADFGGKAGVYDFILKYSPEEVSSQIKSLVSGLASKDDLVFEFEQYDWSQNRR